MHIKLILFLFCSQVAFINGMERTLPVKDDPQAEGAAKKRPECFTVSTAELCQAARDGEVGRIELLVSLEAAINEEAPGYSPPLLEASAHGHEDFVKALLEKGALIDASRKSDRYTSLHVAAQKGLEAMVLLLLERGASVNARTSTDRTPLFVAAEGRQFDVMKVLIPQVKKDECQDDLDWVLLAMVQERAPLDIIQRLLKSGANPNMTSKKDQETPLHSAARFGYVEAAQELLDEGAKIHVKRTSGTTPLRTACREGFIEVVKLLLSRADKAEIKDDIDSIYSDMVAQNGSKEIQEELLAAGATLQLDVTPILVVKMSLTEAAGKGLLDRVTELLAQGAGDKLEGRFRFHPVRKACEAGHAMIVRLLIEKLSLHELQSEMNSLFFEMLRKKVSLGVIKELLNAKVGPNIIEESTQERPLHVAVRNRAAVETIKELLDWGAEVHVKDRNGTSPLRLACVTGRVNVVQALTGRVQKSECQADLDSILVDMVTKKSTAGIIEELIKVGADPNAEVGNSLKSALYLAVENGDTETVTALFGQNTTVQVPCAVLRVACNSNRVAIVSILAAHVNKEECQEDLDALLFEVLDTQGASGNLLDIIQVLLKAGSNPNAKDAAQETPLHKAARLGRVDIVEELVSRSAAVNSESSEGKTALHLACSEGHMDVIRALVAHTADTQVRDGSGKQPLDYWLAAGRKLLDSASNDTLEEILKKGDVRIDENSGTYQSVKTFAAGCLVGVCLLLVWNKLTENTDT